jgi:hypothetical protein
MLRKECSEIFKQSLFFVVLSLSIPLFLKVALWNRSLPYFDIFFLLFQFGLLGVVLYMGNSLFLSDRKQRATDYLFSLPYSKLKLLGIKAVPRLGAVVIFYLVFLLLCRHGGERLLLFSVFSFSYIYFALFIIALSLSASMDNYILMAVVTLMGMILFLVMLYLLPNIIFQLFFGVSGALPFGTFFNLNIGFDKTFLIFLVVLASLLLPFIAAFIFSFKKIGIHPLNRYNKRYAAIFFTLLAVGIFISSIIIYSSIHGPEGPKSYYLTEQHQLVEYDPSFSRLYDADGVDRIASGRIRYWKRPMEKGGYLYVFSYSGGHTYLIQLDLHTRQEKKIYKKPGWIGWRDSRMWHFKKSIAFIENPRYQDRTLILIHTETNTVRKILLSDKLPAGYYYPVLFGADDHNGRRFWLIRSDAFHRSPIMLLWENGEVENLGKTTQRPCYLNRTLITFNKEVAIFHRMSETGMTPIKRIKVEKGTVIDDFHRFNLDKASVKETYGTVYSKEGKKYFRLDMETFKMEAMKAVNEKARQTRGLGYYVARISPEEYYYIEYIKTERKYDIRNVYALNNGELKLIKEFPPVGDNLIKSNVYKGGIVIQEVDKIRIYAFPDLRELTFKKLEYNTYYRRKK